MDIVELLNPLKLSVGVVCGSVRLKKEKKNTSFHSRLEHLSHSCGYPKQCWFVKKLGQHFCVRLSSELDRQERQN